MQMKKRDFISSDFLVGALIAGITILYVSLIFNHNIWTDEAFTMELVNTDSIKDIIKGTAVDVHPPLYYLITYVFVTLFGGSIQVYKMVSVIPMVLTMFLGWFYIKPWFGNKTTVLYLLFLNAIPCVMEYGVQVRMYSWCIFFISLAALSAYGYYHFKSKKHLLFLTLSALCACYTHNFSMISAVFIYILLGISLILKERKFPLEWLLSGVLVSIPYLPWLIVLYNQANNRVGNYWIAPIDKETVMGYFSDIFGSRIPYITMMFVVLWIIAVILLLVSMRNHKNIGIFGIMLFAVPILTTLLGVIVSVLVTPFFVARYLLPCMGLLALGLALGFRNEKGCVYTFLCLFLVCMIGNSYYKNYQAEYHCTNVDELLAYVDENLDDDDIIVYNNSTFDFIYKLYFDEKQLVHLDAVDFGAGYDNILFLDSCCAPWLSNETLVTYGFSKEYIGHYGIEHNDFQLWRIYK